MVGYDGRDEGATECFVENGVFDPEIGVTKRSCRNGRCALELADGAAERLVFDAAVV